MTDHRSSEGYPPVKVIELEDRIEPDNSFEESYAIYFKLSYEPPVIWQEQFEAIMRQDVDAKVVSFIGPTLRVVITRMDYLESVVRQINNIAIQTNEELQFVEE